MNVSSDFLWIAPLVDVVLFLVIGCALLVVIKLLGVVPRIRTVLRPEIVILVLAWLSCYVVLRVPDRLYQSAVLVLSLGLAVRIWTWFRSHPGIGVTLARRSLGWLIGAVALVAVTMRIGAGLAEARAVEALRPTPAGTPNVLLIVMDTLRADHLSGYGYPRQTSPNLDSIAKEGVLFERAISPSSWTLPSHASLFTGRNVHEHGADNEHPVLGSEYPTIAEVMRQNGFLTAGFSANVNWATSQAGLGRGFLRFEDYFQSGSDAVARTVLGKDLVARLVRRLGQRLPLGRRQASEVTDAFVAWVDRTGGKPFFAFLNYFDSHSPYVAPMPYRAQFMTEHQRATEQTFSFVTPDTAAESPGVESLFTAGYDGAIAYMDSEIGRLFAELRERGQLDRTIVVILSDHGEALGDHGLYSHGHSLYMDQIHVPLIVRFPGRVPAGLRVSSPVRLVDVPATILALAGIPSDALPGDPLTRFWDQGASSAPVDPEPILSEVGHRGGVPRVWPISAGWVRSLVTQDWHFIERQGGEVELYRLADDSRELKNLADAPAEQAQVAAFRRKLLEMMQAPRPPVRQQWPR